MAKMFQDINNKKSQEKIKQQLVEKEDNAISRRGVNQKTKGENSLTLKMKETKKFSNSTQVPFHHLPLHTSTLSRLPLPPPPLPPLEFSTTQIDNKHPVFSKLAIPVSMEPTSPPEAGSLDMTVTSGPMLASTELIPISVDQEPDTLTEQLSSTVNLFRF